MLTYPDFNPVALSIDAFTVLGKTIGPISIHWYGIMYLCGFAAGFMLGLYRARRPWTPLQRIHIEDLLFYLAVGLVVGGRSGYVLFYNFGDFLENPLWLFRVWEGGMSFHGGAIGVMVSVFLFCRKHNKHFVDIMDFCVPFTAPGLGFGRFGNFIGQELWGRPTDVSWGMVFPKDPDQLVRHASQLYQVVLEGIVLFAILFWFSRKPRPRGVVSGLFLLCYGIFRFAVEFVRQPDEHLGFVSFGWMTRGQQLCIPMILFGVFLIYWGYRSKVYAQGVEDTPKVQEKSSKKPSGSKKK